MAMQAFGMLAMGAPGSGGSGNPIQFFFPMIVLFAILYFMMIRPQQRRERDRKQMVEAIKSGDRVLFSGGILGTVVNVKPHVFVLKIADNVKIEVARGAVYRVMGKDETPATDNANA